MRSIELKDIKPGQKIARPIYDDSGRILLHKGTVLKDNYILRLQALDIPFIYIEDELIGPIDVPDILHDTVRIQSIKTVKDAIEKAKVSKDIDFRSVSKVVTNILDDIASAPTLLVSVMDMRSKNLHLFSHSVSVAALAIVTGMAIQLDQFKLKYLAMGALLHDVGKGLSEGEDHTSLGFEVIRKNKEINIASAHVAFQHHELYDGTGYPRGLKGEDIHLFAAITAVANYYDNLVSPREAKDKMLPYQAIEKIISESGRSFHPQIVLAFSRKIAPYPIGSLVKLNSGPLGVVIGLHENYPTRPIIKIVTDRFGGRIRDLQEVDLLKEQTIFINQIIDEQERQKLGI